MAVFVRFPFLYCQFLSFLLAIFLCLLHQVGPAQAGAWLRQEGTGFASTSSYVASPFSADTAYHGLYVEYGLTPRLTLGLDLGRGVTGQNKTVVFARVPIKGEGRDRLAFELGAGTIAGQQTLRPGLSYGRGLDTALGPGWLAVDSFAEVALISGEVDYKTDITLGVTRPGGTRWMIQAQMGRAYGEPAFLRLVPSAVIPLGQGWHMELGVSKALTGAREHGVKFGLWYEF